MLLSTFCRGARKKKKAVSDMPDLVRSQGWVGREMPTPVVGYEAMVVEAGVSTLFPSLWDQLEVFPHGKLRLRKAMPEATVGYRCDFETKVLLDRFDQFSGRPPPDTGCDPDVYCLLA